tara:strand:+ start:272 stop:502 length:231 start_codon:yes stop_codon:yes gene_type:complete
MSTSNTTDWNKEKLMKVMAIIFKYHSTEVVINRVNGNATAKNLIIRNAVPSLINELVSEGYTMHLSPEGMSVNYYR